MPDAPIFIGGAGRSGTTLLRVILDSHSRIACGPELKVIPMIAAQRAKLGRVEALNDWCLTGDDLDRLYRDLILGLMEPYRKASGKPRIAEKSPHNVNVFSVLGALFPDSPLVHVIRDGRDVVASLLALDWRDAVTGEPVPYTHDTSEAALYWTLVMAGAHPSRNYIEVRYEDLVQRTEPTLRALFGAIGEPWEDAVMRYAEQPHDLTQGDVVRKQIDPQSVGRWRRDLTEPQIGTVMSIAGEQLHALGYT